MHPPYNLPQLEDQLRCAQRDHDDLRRSAASGVAVPGFHVDCDLWGQLGTAIAGLAHQIGLACRDSQYCSDRPEAAALAARLSESIDDQIDAAAWAVINAAARLRAATLRA
ncbi:MAG TPA: hypothetical protein VGI79_10050 [Caulobacteraceae bacterium]|jgi:hypothetical protein